MLPNWLRLSFLGIFVVLAAIWFVNTWRFHRGRQQGRGGQPWLRLRVIVKRPARPTSTTHPGGLRLVISNHHERNAS